MRGPACAKTRPPVTGKTYADAGPEDPARDMRGRVGAEKAGPLTLPPGPVGPVGARDAGKGARRVHRLKEVVAAWVAEAPRGGAPPTGAGLYGVMGALWIDVL